MKKYSATTDNQQPLVTQAEEYDAAGYTKSMRELLDSLGGYQHVFNAIADATSVYAEGVGVNIGVRAFIRSINPHRPIPADRDVERLREALRPFAHAAKWWKAFHEYHRITTLHQHGDCLEVGHLRAAEAALTETRAADERREAELRAWVAKLYCAAGCDCCRDDDGWKAASDRLGELLGVARYDDGDGVDWYAARDAARAATEPKGSTA